MDQKSSTKKGTILIVDDDINWLKLMEASLSKHFEIVPAKSGPEALEHLKKGLKPSVILTDLNMPVMNGIEFLKESMNYSPNSLRIIISAYSNPKEIIAAINQSRAYMYLMKPVDNFQLIQILRNAVETYILIERNNQLLEAIKKIGITDPKLLVSSLKDKSIEGPSSREIDKQYLNALKEICSLSEKYYFTNHIDFVYNVATEFARQLNFNEKSILEIQSACCLVDIPYFSMPRRFSLYDPFDLEQDDRHMFFEIFKSTVDVLRSVASIQGAVEIFAQIWENVAGTGGPDHLEGANVWKESQIISLVNIYHNKVYRLLPSHFPKFETEGVIVQTKEETFERHNEAVKFLYRKANWWDNDILNGFQSLLKSKTLRELVLPNSNLVLRNVDLKTAKTAKKDIFSDFSAKEEEPEEPEVVEREILVDKLRPGMIVAQNIVTKAGVLIARQDTRLDEGLVDNIKYLSRSGLLPKEISVYVIPPPHLRSDEQQS